MRVLTASQMRDAERRTVDELGIPSIVLMENAGRQVASSIESAIDDAASHSFAVLCGKGNNGGDGFIVARALLARGIDVRVYLVGARADVRGDARVALHALTSLDVDVVEIGDAAAWELHAPAVLACDVIVDAMLGTGLEGPVSGLLESIIADVNGSPRPVVAVDVPTGIDASQATLAGPAIHAALTVTFAAPKVAHVLPPAEHHVGRLIVADIGIPPALVEDLDAPWLEVLSRDTLRAHVTPRAADSQKGDYGRVVIVAGSIGKTGAAFLAAMGALRSGAGLVTVATPRSCVPVLAALGVEYMTLPCDETAGGQVAFEAADAILGLDADVLVIGPGLGRGPSTLACVQSLVERSGVTTVIDADGLAAFVGDTDRLQGREDAAVIITPHPGEMARLVDRSIEEVQAGRVDLARDFATSHSIHVVLKGHRTVVAAPDGRVAINTTGNPGMATGGTGDVLAGVIGAWCGQLFDPVAASQLGVYLHGLAGDLAAADEGEVAMIAGDVLDRLGDAVLELTATARRSADADHD